MKSNRLSMPVLQTEQSAARSQAPRPSSSADSVIGETRSPLIQRLGTSVDGVAPDYDPVTKTTWQRNEGSHLPDFVSAGGSSVDLKRDRYATFCLMHIHCWFSLVKRSKLASPKNNNKTNKKQKQAKKTKKPQKTQLYANDEMLNNSASSSYRVCWNPLKNSVEAFSRCSILYWIKFESTGLRSSMKVKRRIRPHSSHNGRMFERASPVLLQFCSCWVQIT